MAGADLRPVHAGSCVSSGGGGGGFLGFGVPVPVFKSSTRLKILATPASVNCIPPRGLFRLSFKAHIRTVDRRSMYLDSVNSSKLALPTFFAAPNIPSLPAACKNALAAAA